MEETGNGNTPRWGEQPVRALTVPEVAERLAVSEAKAWALVGRGAIRSFKIDTSRRVMPDAVDEYIAGLIAEDQARRAESVSA